MKMMEEWTEAAIESQVEVDVREGGIKIERQIVEDECKPILHIDIKEEYSLDNKLPMECKQSAVPVSNELMNEWSETAIKPLEVEVDVMEGDIKIERGISEDECKPILHIDIKEEHSFQQCLWKEQDHLPLPPNLEHNFEFEEELKTIKTVKTKASSQPNSGKSCTRQPNNSISVGSQESPLSTNSILQKTIKEPSCTTLIGKKITKCSCTIECKCEKAESMLYNLLTERKRYNCDSCNTVFSDEFSLLLHCREHTFKRFQCPTCSEVFKFKSHLIRHCREHTKEKQFQCPTCCKVFKFKSHLIRHCRVHTGEKPFPCPSCEKAFRLKDHLIRHCRKHSGEKPYQCHTCSKAFSVKATLIEHCRTHTGEKPYQCHLCSKVFNHRSAFTDHVRSHKGEKPYECHLCTKVFSNRSALKVHCRCHNGEKPYQCDICTKAFSVKTRLLLHRRMHTGEKPYQCHTCGVPFTQKSGLIIHSKKHTNEKH